MVGITTVILGTGQYKLLLAGLSRERRFVTHEMITTYQGVQEE